MSQQGWHAANPSRPDRHPHPVPPAQPASAGGGLSSAITPVRPVTGPPPTPPPAESFEAVELQSVLTRARDHSRFVAPEIAQERPRRPFPAKALLAAFLTVLLIGIATGLVYVTWFRQPAQDPEVLVQPTATASNDVRAATPQDIVTAYFDALGVGDIDRALSMGPRGGNGTGILITPAVYARTMAIAPVGNLEIVTADPAATELQVRYTVGDRPVETSIRLVRLDTGEYQLARTTVPIQILIPGGQNLPMKINGQTVDHTHTFEVVPGSYQLSTGLPFIDYPATSEIHVNSLARSEVLAVNVTPELTDDGRRAFLSAAKESLRRCIAQVSLAPIGCPNGAVSSNPVNQRTIRWELVNDPWRTATPTLGVDDQSVAVMTVGIVTKLSFEYASGASRSDGDPRQMSAQASASMLVRNASDVTITWAR